MNNLKKIILPLGALFLIYQTYELVKSLTLTQPTNYSVINVTLISFLLTLYITGVFALTGFAYPTNKLLPASYYQIKNPKQLKKVYHLIGVDYFRQFLLATFWGTKKNKKKYFNGTKAGLENFIYQTKQSEFGHFAAMVVIAILSFFLFFQGYVLLVIIMAIINIIGNLYPVILQRFHRLRIEKISKRIK